MCKCVCLYVCLSVCLCACVCVCAFACFLYVCYPVHVCIILINLCVVKIHCTIQRSRLFLYANVLVCGQVYGKHTISSQALSEDMQTKRIP